MISTLVNRTVLMDYMILVDHVLNKIQSTYCKPLRPFDDFERNPIYTVKVKKAGLISMAKLCPYHSSKILSQFVIFSTKSFKTKH